MINLNIISVVYDYIEYLVILILLSQF